MTRKKRDANHGELRQAARALGAVWIDTCGDQSIGFDALLAYRGELVAVEVKDGTLPPSARELTPTERARADELDWVGVHVVVLKSVSELAELMSVMEATSSPAVPYNALFTG